jgi:hypothetical protein
MNAKSLYIYICKISTYKEMKKIEIWVVLLNMCMILNLSACLFG